MKERPILFKGPLVRAILAGQKTVTRRAVTPQFHTAPIDVVDGVPSWDSPTNYAGEVQMNTQRWKPCPYGKPGDQLWVRETWYCDHFEVMRGPYLKPDDLDIREALEDGTLVYAADGLTPYEQEQPTWKPSIHMPRWASRILLEITDVRVERLQDISEHQAVAEGLIWQGQESGKTFYSHAERNYPPGAHQQFGISGVDAASAFRNLWNSVGGDWDANPWVWVVEFKRVTP